MISIFTIPKPFFGQSNIIQRNALKSWNASGVDDIILIGDDNGVADVAEEYGFVHIPHVEKNEIGTPLLSSAFSTAQKVAKHNLLMYINTDIILLPNLISAIQVIHQLKVFPFLISGRRWDIDIKNQIDFSESGWQSQLEETIKREGKLHGYSGMDYFIFPRYLINMPPFAVGRPGWDPWLVYNMKTKGIAFIDATKSITAIHQNHDFSHSVFGKKKYVHGPEYEKNIQLSGGYSCHMTLRDATWVLEPQCLRRPNFLGRAFSILSMFYLCRLILGIKRKLYDKFFR